MSTLRTSSFIFGYLLIAVFLMACDRQIDKTTSAPALPEVSIAVPGNTPYLYLSEGLSETARQILLRSGAPFVSGMSGAEIKRDADMSQALTRLLDGFESVIAEAEDDEDIYTLFGLKSAGYTLVYGLDWVPVMRIEIDDPNKAVESIEQMAEMGRFSWNVLGEGKRAYRIDEMEMLVGINNENLTLSFYPVRFAPEWRQRVFEPLEKTETGKASEMLSDIATRHGLSAYGLGWFDPARMMERYFNSDSDMMVTLRNENHQDLDQEKRCYEQLDAAMEPFGKIAFGLQQVSEQQVSTRLVMELDATVYTLLNAATGKVPGKGYMESAMFSVRSGLDSGAFVREGRKYLQTVADKELSACGQTRNGGKLIDKRDLAKPLPPMATSFRGLALYLSDYEKEAEQGSGLMLLGFEKPQMLWGMVSMFVPGLAELPLQDNGEPVRVDQFGSMAPHVNTEQGMHLAMNSDYIGLAAGADASAQLADLMKARSDERALLIVEYNLPALQQAGALKEMLHATAMREQLNRDLAGFGLTRYKMHPENNALYLDYKQDLK